MKKSVLLYFVLFLLTFNEGCCIKSTHENMEKGNMIIHEIEEFKIVHDSLPDKLLDVIQSEYVGGVLYCYEKVSDSSYVLWIGTTLGEGMYYYSDTKMWENKSRSIK